MLLPFFPQKFWFSTSWIRSCDIRSIHGSANVTYYRDNECKCNVLQGLEIWQCSQCHVMSYLTLFRAGWVLFFPTEFLRLHSSSSHDTICKCLDSAADNSHVIVLLETAVSGTESFRIWEPAVICRGDCSFIPACLGWTWCCVDDVSIAELPVVHLVSGLLNITVSDCQHSRPTGTRLAGRTLPLRTAG